MRIRQYLLLAAAILLATTGARAYVLNGPRWAVAQVPYYINPANADVSSASALAAIQAGANAWSAQSNASISLYYMGQTSGTTLENNGKNEIFFRNTSNGGVIAETYWWYDANNHLVDADMVFYDGGFHFFTGSSGCSSGVYIEDTATHEFGHVLGLGHSSVASATMYATASWCSTSGRSLDPDDLAGVEELYPPGGPVNTAPAVAITGPANNSSITQGTALAFTGSASDQEDGSLSSRIVWTSSIDGQIGVGSSVTATLSAGTHTVTAQVSDSGGLSATSQVAVTVASVQAPAPPPAAPAGISLSAVATKVKGLQQARLYWSGAASSSVDVYRDGSKVMTTPNDGSQTDAINKKGGGTYTYKLCEAGSTTCSASVVVTF